jgi:hypothetical protein
VPADRYLLEGIEHDIGGIAPDNDDSRSRPEQCRHFVGRNDLRIVGYHEVEVDIGQLMPGPGAHRAEHRHCAHPAIMLVMRDDVPDQGAVRATAKPGPSSHAARVTRTSRTLPAQSRSRRGNSFSRGFTASLSRLQT